MDPRQFYEAAYGPAAHRDAARLGRWRALGAVTKADPIVRLCESATLEPHRIVEIGCGDGALLDEMAARTSARVLDGFDISVTAARLARERDLPGVRVRVYDGRRLPVDDDSYDMAVLSHVVEHVADPRPLLDEAARVAPWVLIEVPLEENRSAARAAKRAEAARIGHVAFYDRAQLRSLVEDVGLEICGEVTDPLPYRHHAFFAERRADRIRALSKTLMRTLTWRLAARRAERWFTVHYACLARRPVRGSNRQRRCLNS